MPSTSMDKTDRAFFALDDQSERMRPMCEDRELMEWLQYQRRRLGAHRR